MIEATISSILGRRGASKYSPPGLIRTNTQRRIAAIARRRRKKADLFFDSRKLKAAESVGRWLFGGGR